ncbi:MAG TPA: cation transporter [Planctomycetaceae bacterium]|nr:cation transporter [Planctomycetaceae bacterium]
MDHDTHAGSCECHAVENELQVSSATKRGSSLLANPADQSGSKPPMDSTREADTRAGRRLEYFSLSWNVIESAVSVGAGLAADSIALIGFGVDAVIESLSGSVMLWRLRHDHVGEQRERVALRLVGISFLILAVYVGFGAVRMLLRREPPEASLVGIVLSCLSLAIMPNIARAKRRVAVRLASRALQADSRQTQLCAYLSAILLGGLVLNAAFGWWWADPVAALVMVPIIIREAVEALRGQACSDCH